MEKDKSDEWFARKKEREAKKAEQKWCFCETSSIVKRNFCLQIGAWTVMGCSVLANMTIL